MVSVLLLNNACYVDSIKVTWVKKASHHSGTVGRMVRAALKDNLSKLETVNGFFFFYSLVFSCIGGKTFRYSYRDKNS